MEKYQSIGKHEAFVCRLNAERGIYVRICCRIKELKRIYKILRESLLVTVTIIFKDVCLIYRNIDKNMIIS